MKGTAAASPRAVPPGRGTSPGWVADPAVLAPPDPRGKPFPRGACPVPVALLIFNRPELTRQVFAAIRAARPERLFVVADGPRHPGEAARCAAARAVVAQVDWDCDVRTRFSETNLGCGRGPATGIDWVFEQVEEAIILEDDCLPGPSFFRFCAALLEHYRHDARVMHLSGSNYLTRLEGYPYSYLFSQYTLSWGWATWRRAWRYYDAEMRSWPKFKAEGRLRSICPDPVEAARWERKFDAIHEKRREDAWDFQWNYAVWTQNGLSVLPAANLVSNIGFGPDATHTRQPGPRANLPAAKLDELVHPPFLLRDARVDRMIFDRFLGGDRWRERTWKRRLSKPLRLCRKLFAGR